MTTIKSYSDIENKTNDELIGFGDIVSPSYEQWADIDGFNGKNLKCCDYEYNYIYNYSSMFNIYSMFPYLNSKYIMGYFTRT
jgi:hypothetical protein